MNTTESYAIIIALLVAGGLWYVIGGPATPVVDQPPVAVVPITTPLPGPPSTGEGPSVNQPQPVVPPDVVNIATPPAGPPSVGEKPSANQPMPFYPPSITKPKPKPKKPIVKPVNKKPCVPCPRKPWKPYNPGPKTRLPLNYGD